MSVSKLIVKTSLLLLFGVGSSVFAQKTDPNTQKIDPKILQGNGPASVQDVNSLIAFTSVSTCTLLMQEVPFEKAIRANAEAFITIILKIYKGEISNGPKFENINEINNFFLNTSIPAVGGLCLNKLPAPIQDQLKKSSSPQKNN